MGDEKSKDERIVHITSMIGPLAGLAATIIATFSNLPPVIQHIMVLLLVMITLVSIYVVFGKWIIKLVKNAATAIKHHFLTKKYFSKFNMFIDRFGELLKDNRCDNIPYVFTHLGNMPSEFNDLRSALYDVGNLFAVFKNEMKKVHKRDFERLIKWFQSILRAYNNQLVVKPFRRIRNQHRDKMSEHDKEAYETSRENHVRFLQDYENFAKAINKDWGEKIAQDYFEKPGKL